MYSQVFPEGFFVVLDGDRVAGQGAGIFLDFDFDHPQHTIAGITGDHQCANHDPDGAVVLRHRHGRSTRLPAAGDREAACTRFARTWFGRHNKRGIIAGGHMAGYGDHRDAMDTETYLRKVADRRAIRPHPQLPDGERVPARHRSSTTTYGTK